MFLAAIRLRYKFPDVKRAFTIPGGKVGLWSVCVVGLISCIFTIGIGFVPPSQIPVGNLRVYELILIVGTLVGCLMPFALYKFSNRINRKLVSVAPICSAEI